MSRWADLRDWWREAWCPWHLKYRLVERHIWDSIRKKIEIDYKIQACIKYFPLFWWDIDNRSYTYFSNAYTEMTTLRGIPKFRILKLSDADCTLRLMGENDDDD
jgi:hypothetical protein